MSLVSLIYPPNHHYLLCYCVSLTQAQDMQVASQACSALANLAEISTNQDVIANDGAVKPVISSMRSKFIEVQREAGRLLANLCASESELTNQIVQTGGHNLLISYLLSQDTACQRVGSLGAYCLIWYL